MLNISLDQNFLWNFHAGKKPAAARLHAALKKAVTEKKAICPLHVGETIFESAMLPAELRTGIFAVAEPLSRGSAFRHFGWEIACETLALVRPQLRWSALRPGTLLVPPETNFAVLGQQNRAAKVRYGDRLGHLAYPPRNYKPSMSVDEIHAAIVRERAGSMFRLVEAVRSHGNLRTGRSEWEFTQEIARFLLEQNITGQECARLTDTILHHKWETSPTLYAHSRLCAQLETDYLKAKRTAKANDALDLTRIAIALKNADVICCDHPMSVLIHQSKVRELYRPSYVFSLKQADEAAQFIERL